MPEAYATPGKRLKENAPGRFYPGLGRSCVVMGSAYGSRTRDLRLERAASWTTRRMRHAAVYALYDTLSLNFCQEAFSAGS